MFLHSFIGSFILNLVQGIIHTDKDKNILIIYQSDIFVDYSIFSF